MLERAKEDPDGVDPESRELALSAYAALESAIGMLDGLNERLWAAVAVEAEREKREPGGNGEGERNTG